MNNNDKRVMFSSDREDWETPGWLLDRVEKEFGKIGLDAAAGHDNCVCPKYLTVAEDGLKTDWNEYVRLGTKLVWLNPPYGRTNTPAWVEKALTSVLDSTIGLDAAVLIPARTETTWFHEFCLRGDLYFLKGRVRFCIGGEAMAAAPFPSVIVHFTKKSVKRASPRCHFVDWRE